MFSARIRGIECDKLNFRVQFGHMYTAILPKMSVRAIGLRLRAETHPLLILLRFLSHEYVV